MVGDSCISRTVESITSRIGGDDGSRECGSVVGRDYSIARRGEEGGHTKKSTVSRIVSTLVSNTECNGVGEFLAMPEQILVASGGGHRAAVQVGAGRSEEVSMIMSEFGVCFRAITRDCMDKGVKARKGMDKRIWELG